MCKSVGCRAAHSIKDIKPSPVRTKPTKAGTCPLISRGVNALRFGNDRCGGQARSTSTF